MNLGLYIHIPFCRRKCLYCDFTSFAGAEELYEAYTAALCREISGKGGLFAGHRVDSVYLGGGTPTVLPPEALARLGAAVKGYWNIAPDAEFTVEANPGTLDREKLAVLRSMGANRLSIGVQAFDDAVLQAAGRIHSAGEAVRTVEDAAQAGFENISIDLMYGLPGQTAAGFRAGLELAAGLPLRHISVYGLKVEDGTPFSRLQAAGKLPVPEEEEEDAMYELAVRFLPESGLARYEISNYARAGGRCRHNLKYWHYQPYIGLGVAAHSFWQGERTANTGDLKAYLRAVAGGGCPVVSCERPDRETAMAEYAFLALRTAEGLDFSDFHRHFAVDFNEKFASRIGKFRDSGLLAADAEGLRLTDRGMKYGNVIFAAFLPD
ncbi:MAG TPA: radical SAM family heme chaperone HemW [Selenomonadales bacterium]|nr:radical SAM family heme chaperone HemW [Selenomonadales bacterium]